MIAYYLTNCDIDLKHYGFKENDKCYGIMRNGWCRLRIDKQTRRITFDSIGNDELLVFATLFSIGVVSVVDKDEIKIQRLRKQIRNIQNKRNKAQKKNEQ